MIYARVFCCMALATWVLSHSVAVLGVDTVDTANQSHKPSTIFFALRTRNDLLAESVWVWEKGREKIPQEEDRHRTQVFCLVFDIVWLRRQFVVLFVLFFIVTRESWKMNRRSVTVLVLNFYASSMAADVFEPLKGFKWFIRNRFRLNFVFHNSAIYQIH